MPSVTQIDYLVFEFNNTTLTDDQKKEIGRMVKNGTIWDCIFHFKDSSDDWSGRVIAVDAAGKEITIWNGDGKAKLELGYTI